MTRSQPSLCRAVQSSSFGVNLVGQLFGPIEGAIGDVDDRPGPVHGERRRPGHAARPEDQHHPLVQVERRPARLGQVGRQASMIAG